MPHLSPRRATRLERRLVAVGFVVLTLAVAAQRFWPRYDEPLRVTLSAFGDDGDGTDRLVPVDPWGRMVVPLPLRGEPPQARHLRAATFCLALARDMREARVEDAARYCARIGAAHLQVAEALGADAAAIGSAAGPRLRRGPFWVELGGWPDYSLGPDGRDDLGAGDDVPVIRGHLRLALYLVLPSAGASLALLLVAGLVAARLAPLLPGRPLLEVLVSAPLALLALAGAALARELLPLDPLEELWGGRPETEALLGSWAALLVPPRVALFGSVLVALWCLVAILRLRWDVAVQHQRLLAAPRQADPPG